MEKHSNIVLIGMPGSGKSTVGVILAKKLAKNFVDTDLLIQASEHRPLQKIVDMEGYMALRRIEERLLLGLKIQNHVIATGGSAVYSHGAMVNLRSDGIVVFLDADLATLKNRIIDFSVRGIAGRPEQSLADLFEERNSLYNKYADIIIDCNFLSQETACVKIIEKLGFAFRS